MGTNASNDNTAIDSVLTIDNAGVIPVFDQTATTTIIYVHNNGDANLSGISYQITNNDSTSLGYPVLVNASECASIAAGNNCALMLTTPIVNDLSIQGSFNIVATYSSNGIQNLFTQLVNYHRIRQISTKGAAFSSSTLISGYGNPVGYAMFYLYGSSSESYVVSGLTINKPAVTVTAGNLSGQGLSAGSVHAIEVSAAIPEIAAIDGEITVASSIVAPIESMGKTGFSLPHKALSESSQYSDSTNIVVYPDSAPGYLKAGFIPVINTAASPAGSLILQNVGNQSVNVSSIEAESGITLISDCKGIAILPGASCVVTFQVAGNAGNGNLTVNYTSAGKQNSLHENVIWLNGNDYALVDVLITDEPLSFPATTIGSTEVIVTNIGKYALSNIQVIQPQTLTGSATATISDNSCSDDLAINQSCSYQVNAYDNVTELNKQIELGFSATYATSQTLTQTTILNYDSTDYAAIITITPDLNLTVTGDNYSYQTGTLILANSGNVPAQLSGMSISNNPAYLTATNDCSSQLEPGASCNINLKLGPVFSTTIESGTASYRVSYTAAGQSAAGVVNSNIDWLVNSSDFIFTTLSGNGDFNCALGNNQAAYCWGKGQAGQIGNAANLDVNVPTAAVMPVNVNFTKLSTNSNFSCAIGDDYAAYCWGVGLNGQIGNGHNQSVNVPTMVEMPGGMKFAQISTNPSFSCALTRSGRAFCWGDATNGHIGNGTEKSIKNTPKLVTMPGEVRFTQISTNSNFSCALGNDSLTYCWGYGESGQMGNGQNQTATTPVAVTMPVGVSFIQISTNENYSCALGNNAAIYCWGYGPYGQLGDGSTGINNIPTKITMPIGVSFSYVGTSTDFSCALSTVGTVYCWGYGAAGRLGNNGKTNMNIPVLVTMPSGITFSQLSVGSNSSCALGNDKASYCWGAGANGKIGNGANQNVLIPTKSIMPNGVDFYQMVVSQYLSCAMTTTGDLYCWGGGGYGRLGNGSDNDVNVPNLVIMPL